MLYPPVLVSLSPAHVLTAVAHMTTASSAEALSLFMAAMIDSDKMRLCGKGDAVQCSIKRSDVRLGA